MERRAKQQRIHRVYEQEFRDPAVKKNEVGLVGVDALAVGGVRSAGFFGSSAR
jgi:hypothetical protein